ncbi:MAG: hypothetical protein GY705_14105 [Bacteroidetes bacterium]|nr:hypothetical protein [Bacteroidota bacterium]
MKNLLILFILLSLSACTVTENVEFKKIENVQFKGATLQGDITLTANAILNNPNDFGVEIKRIQSKVFIDDKEVSNLRQEVSTQMTANSDFSLPLEIDIPAKKVFGDVGGLIGGLLKNKTVLLKMESVVTLDILGKEVDIPYTHEEEKGLKL